QRACRDRALCHGVRGGRRAGQARGLCKPLRRRFLRPAAQQGHDHAAAQGMERAEDPALRRRGPRAAARRRDDSVAIGVKHPIFDPVRPWLERTGSAPSLELLNSLSLERNLKSESGKPIRFVPPSSSDPYYEVHVFETGHVQTRPDNRHDLFNALAWLAFPITKARINAMHAAEIPREGGTRGRLRDMLTIFDEGGAIVACDEGIAELVREAR